MVGHAYNPSAGEAERVVSVHSLVRESKFIIESRVSLGDSVA